MKNRNDFGSGTQGDVLSAPMPHFVFRAKDPASALTHFIGMVLAIFGTFPVLLRASADGLNMRGMVSVSVFMAGMILLYGASAAYHGFDISPRANLILKRVDHAMVYLLIASSYTVVCTLGIGGQAGRVLEIAVWCIALAGSISTLWWVNCPKWVSAVLYVALGWACLFTGPQMVAHMAGMPLFWLASGGVIYTVGAVIYALKLPLPGLSPAFGNHEVFHLFVMAGSLCHYLLVLFCLV